MGVFSNANDGSACILKEDGAGYDSQIIPAMTAAYSFSFWIKLRSETFDGGYNYEFLDFWNGSSEPDYIFAFTGWVGWGCATRSWAVEATLGDAFIPKIGMWRKYVVTRSQTAMHVYVDGLDTGAEDTDTAFLSGTSYGFYGIAGNSGAPTGYRDFPAVMGPFAMWDRALSKSEALVESGHKALMPLIREGLLSVCDPKGLKNTGGDTLGLLWNRYGKTGPYISVETHANEEHDPNAPWLSHPRVRLILPGSPPAIQILRPSADYQDGSWTPSEGVDLYACIDEVNVSDSDLIRSSQDPTNDEAIVKIQTGTDPASSTGHTVRFRYRKGLALGTLSLVVTLYENTGSLVARASQTINDVPSAWTDGSFALSGAEADSISNYGNLYLGFKANRSA